MVTATRDAVARCHAGEGPAFFEIMSVRWTGSNRIWPQLITGPLDLRMAWGETPTAGDHAAWFERHDPVLRFARDVLAAGVMSRDEWLRLDREVCERMAAAEQFAVESPWPEPNSAFDRVFARAELTQ